MASCAKSATLATLARYAAPSWHDFSLQARRLARDAQRILDLGAGAQPCVALQFRARGCWYAGLDLSRRELEKAPPGVYSDLLIADIADYLPACRESFDLVLSANTLEHVSRFDLALASIHAYLRPGGRALLFFSGRYSIFACGNRLLPNAVSRWLLRVLLQRIPDTVFPARYHCCWASAVVRLVRPWRDARLTPVYHGAEYLAFSRPLQRAYLGYEEWVRRHHLSNLATHYLLELQK